MIQHILSISMSMSGVKGVFFGLVIGLILGVLAAYLFSSFIPVGIGGADVKNVYTEPGNLVLTLPITSGNGKNMEFLNIGKLVVNEDSSIMVSLGGVDYDVSRFSDVSISAVITLESDGKTYDITTPCIFSSTTCSYVQRVWLGYEVPMVVESGVYDVSVKLSWSSDNSGDFKLQINIDEV